MLDWGIHLFTSLKIWVLVRSKMEYYWVASSVVFSWYFDIPSYGLDDFGARIRLGARDFFCSPQRPDRFWEPPSHFFSGCQSSFLRVKPQRLEQDHLHLVPRLRMSGAVALHLLYAFVAWTGTTWPFNLGISTDLQTAGPDYVTEHVNTSFVVNLPTGTNYVTVFSRPLIETV
jgi:hypothetical protein